jgi:hypothetical protein
VRVHNIIVRMHTPRDFLLVMRANAVYDQTQLAAAIGGGGGGFHDSASE